MAHAKSSDPATPPKFGTCTSIRVNISKTLKDVSNTLQNFTFIGAAVFEIAGGPWYKVWVPKGLVREGLKASKPPKRIHACI